MNKKKIIIIVSYILTLFLFIIVAELNTDRFVQWYKESMNYGNILIAAGPIFIATDLHILITLIIAIIVKFNKKIDTEIKRLFYKLPISTIFLCLPIAMLSSYIVF